MKSIVAAVALSVAVASPAAGKSKGKKRHIHARPAAHAVQVAPQPRAVYAQPDHRPHSPNPQWDVYRSNGEYAGSDPDPHVRLMLRLDDPNADP